MAGQEKIWSVAREDLILLDKQGQQDVFLWEHTERVVRNAGAIAALPEPRSSDLDETALTAAALYHDAGWAIQYRQGDVDRNSILAKATSREQREAAAALLEKRLAAYLSTRSLATARMCVEMLNDRQAALAEARILADAESLDQIGPLLLCQIVRRLGLEGKGVQATIDAWQTRKKYRYWDGWIESFHHDSVREVARERLQQVDRFMEQLACQHTGMDLSPTDVRSTPAL